MARSVARTAYPVVAGLFVACAIIQVFLAGLGVFDDPSSFITHRNFGYLFGWLTLVLLVITSLALISLDERGSAVINSARTAAQDVVSPLQSLADDVINPVTDWFDGLGRADELQAENERLRAQLDRARSEIAAAKGSLAELTELRAILDRLDAAGIEADELTVHTPDLDDVFFALTGGSDVTDQTKETVR